MKKAAISLTFFTILSGLPAGAQTAPTPHTVDGVRAWHTSQGFTKTPPAFPLEYEIDLNTDGAKELFLATEMGTRGATYTVFAKSGKRYNILAETIRGGKYPFELIRPKNNSYCEFRGFQSTTRGTKAYTYEYNTSEADYEEAETTMLTAAEEAKLMPPPPPTPGPGGKDLSASIDAIDTQVDLIEAKLNKSASKTATVEENGEVSVQKAWYDSNNNMIKAQDDAGADSSNGQLIEYYFGADRRLAFVFKQLTTTSKFRGTKLIEERHYFMDGKLLRSSLKSGTKADIATAKEQITDGDGKGDGGYDTFLVEANAIASRLKKGGGAPPPGPAAATILWLDDTTSPNRKYSLGWAPASGLASDVTTDKKLRDPKLGAKNYLVDVASNKVLATTNGTDHPANSWAGVVWSPNSAFMIETVQSPTATTACAMWAVNSGSASPPYDVFAAAKAALYAQMKANRHKSYTSHGTSFTLSFDAPKVDNTGEIKITLEGKVTPGRNDSHDFEASIILEVEANSRGQLILGGSDVEFP